MAVQREADSRDSSLILVAIDKLKKKKLPGPLRNKHLLDFEKLKIKQDWEKKLLNVVDLSLIHISEPTRLRRIMRRNPSGSSVYIGKC